MATTDVPALEPPAWFREGIAWVLAVSTTMNVVMGYNAHYGHRGLLWPVVPTAVLLGVCVYAVTFYVVVKRPRWLLVSE